MELKIPSKEEENSEVKDFKTMGRKRKLKLQFSDKKREDSKSVEEERDQKTKGGKKKKRQHVSRKVNLEYWKNEPKKETDIFKTPEKIVHKVEEKDLVEEEIKIPEASNFEESKKIFDVRKVSKVPMTLSANKAMQLLIETKPNPLKEISKIIFRNARKKKILQIPENPFRIYLENMGHFTEDRALQTKNALNYHQPAVAVILETTPFYHKGFVTYAKKDSKQQMIIMIRRDLLHEIQIFQYNGFPMIKTFNTMFCVVHSVSSSYQHIRLPNITDRVVYVGDFNTSSVAGLKDSNLQSLLEKAENFNFESTWEVGYISLGVKGGATFIDQSDRDHQAMIFTADFQEPEKKLVPNVGKIKRTVEAIIEAGVKDPHTIRPFTQALNEVKGLKIRAKAVFSRDYETDILKPAPKVWERLKSSSSPFVKPSEVRTEVLESLKKYFQRFPPYQEEIEFTQEDYNVAFYMFSYFLQRPKSQLMHSNARDRNGVSYGDILEATSHIVREIRKKPENVQKEEIRKLFNYFWRQFINQRFTNTKCFLNRKRAVITEHKHLRMLSIQDSMWKFLEVIFQPVTWICNRIAIHNIPGTFGFVPGGATFNAFKAKCPQLEENENMRQQNLTPENVSEEELDSYLAKLDKELEKKKELGDKYDPTEFFFQK
jgi:hypothetical protein